MKTVTVLKSELVRRLIDNLEAHKTDFAEAHSAWKLKAIEFHNQRIDDIENGITVLTPKDKVEPLEPASYVKNYVQALEMLQMEVAENVTISQEEFRQFVQDEWSFSDHFRNQVQGYTGKLRNNF